MSPTSRTPTTPNEKLLEHPLDHQEQFRRRANELYEQRGKEDGHDLEDWLQADPSTEGQSGKILMEGENGIVRRRAELSGLTTLSTTEGPVICLRGK